MLGLACDALLVRSGTDGGRLGFVTERWRRELGDLAVDGFLERVPGESDRVVLIREGDTIKQLALWAGFTGDRGDEPVEWYAKRTSSRTAMTQGRQLLSMALPCARFIIWRTTATS